MAVYTEVNEAELASFLADYDLGHVLALKGIAEGVENSNYVLHVDAGYFILTLYEKRVDERDLPFFLGLMEHLAAHGLNCPQPVRNRAWQCARQDRRPPGGDRDFLEGMWHGCPSVRRCAPPLARRLASCIGPAPTSPDTAPMPWASTLGQPSLKRPAPALMKCGQALPREIAKELTFLTGSWPRHLPRGVIHADLFPDNVLFVGDELSGLIDFYFACTDELAYDVAISLNAWCFEPDGSFNITKGLAFFNAYEACAS